MYLRAASTYISVLIPVGSLEVSFVYCGEDSMVAQTDGWCTSGLVLGRFVDRNGHLGNDT